MKNAAKDYPAAVRLFEAAKKEGTTVTQGTWEELPEWKREMYIRLAHATINKS